MISGQFEGYLVSLCWFRALHEPSFLTSTHQHCVVSCLSIVSMLSVLCASHSLMFLSQLFSSFQCSASLQQQFPESRHEHICMYGCPMSWPPFEALCLFLPAEKKESKKISHLVDTRWAEQAPSPTSASAPSTTLVVGTRNGPRALCSGGKFHQGLEPEMRPLVSAQFASSRWTSCHQDSIYTPHLGIYLETIRAFRFARGLA